MDMAPPAKKVRTQPRRTCRVSAPADPLAGTPSQWTVLLDESSEARLKIGIENGIDFSCMCFSPLLQSTTPLLPHVFGPQPCTFRNGQIFREPTQAAFVRETNAFGEGYVRMVMGNEADLSLKNGHIVEDQIIKSRLATPNNDGPMRLVPSQIQQKLTTLLGKKKEVIVEDVFNQKQFTRRIVDNRSIIREYVRFLLQVAMKHFAEITGFSTKVVTKIFQRKTDIAISVSTVWADPERKWNRAWMTKAGWPEWPGTDFYRNILMEVGFPDATVVLWTAKASAIAEIMAERADQINRSSINHDRLKLLRDHFDGASRLIITIGEESVEMCLVRVYATKSHLKLADEVQVYALRAGGFRKLNEIFKQYLRGLLGMFLIPAVRQSGMEEDTLFELIAKGFDSAKREFLDQSISIDVPSHLELSHFPGLDTSGGRQITLKGLTVQKIFNQWLRAIALRAEQQIREYSWLYPDFERLEVVLNGPGCQPGYVIDAMSQRLQTDTVRVRASSAHEDLLSVAQGTYWSLMANERGWWHLGVSNDSKMVMGDI